MDPALAQVVEHQGLHGLQLLTPSLGFEDLEQLALRDEGSKMVLDAITGLGDYAKLPAFHSRLEDTLGVPIAIFATVSFADGQPHLYTADFDFKRRNVRLLHPPSVSWGNITDPTKCLVLGIVYEFDPSKPTKGKLEQPIKFCRRVLDEAPRGAVVHDCTSFSPGSNLVGPIIASFSFAECFAVGALAKPAIALSDRGLLRVPHVEVPDRVLQAWSGVIESSIGTGLAIEDPRKIFFTANIVDEGGSVVDVVASAHDFHCMSHLLECFNTATENGVKPITKPIVFCPTNKVARRCMAVFRALASQRVREAQERGDATTANLYSSIVSNHVFQSDCSAPGLGQTYEERKRLIWRFRGAVRAVLFNVDLLSTGVDIPCCDCTYLHSPSTVSGSTSRSLKPCDMTRFCVKALLGALLSINEREFYSIFY